MNESTQETGRSFYNVQLYLNSQWLVVTAQLACRKPHIYFTMMGYKKKKERNNHKNQQKV